MKVLVIGSGGREHALVWKIAQSRQVEKIYCAPGNGGISEIAECVDIRVTDIDRLLQFATDNEIDLTVVGPEVPLSLGIADIFERKGLRIFGPTQRAAMLESSKAFSKEFMKRNNIPTARYKVCKDPESATKEAESFGYPVVIKADGLAAGKGVIIAENKEQAAAAIDEIMTEKKFGAAGGSVVIEEYLTGKEASILAFVDGNTAVPMVSAQDYKRALDGDEGPNTGGMGAVSPAFYYDEAAAKLAEEYIIKRTIDSLKKEGIIYKGVLYFGLMLTEKGPKLLEYNARFGDPETEVVLPRLKTDLVDIMNSVIDGNLKTQQIEWKEESAVCVVMASGGYPGHYEKGYEIKGLDSLKDEKDITVFHAGTKKSSSKTVTSGGRVIVVSALAENAKLAREKAYETVKRIDFNKVHYRKDIGKLI